MTTGERINQLAKERGLSIHKLATLAGVSYNTLYSAVKRKSDRVDRKIVEKVAKALDVDVRTVISDEQYLNDYTQAAFTKYPALDAVDALIHVFSQKLTYEARLKILDYVVSISRSPENLKSENSEESTLPGDKTRAYFSPIPEWEILWKIVTNDKETEEWIKKIETK